MNTKQRSKLLDLSLSVSKMIARALSQDDPSVIPCLEALLSAKRHQVRQFVQTVKGQDLLGPDQRFGEPVFEFKFTVPNDYDHKSQLKDGRNKNHWKSFNQEITDKNFSNVTDKLVPGKTYLAQHFKRPEGVSTDDCLSFLKDDKKSLLVGAQGLLLVHYLSTKDSVGNIVELAQPSTWIIALDHLNSLPKISGSHGTIVNVPTIMINGQNDKHHFELSNFTGFSALNFPVVAPQVIRLLSVCEVD